eukprot:CAMPEP_0185032074 /NCGR_PEP_ID=MMETSP1103-20130426/19919_1 /TAXON_ID=36769 /ORGANISM="Paraphysomonas bandaiensis, Strain Caron Lab Isolate" /LENGTH=560 /DNA_ID=CAMNT_0027567833 /DNA_START=250 /DNA_END=1932 /DNA_ORIENTATION=+
MAKAFGWPFILSVFIVYGFQQGLGNSWFFQARDYYFKDVLKIPPAEAQSFIAASQTPWNLKPIYGMTSDSLPIYGFHRIPYIILAGVIGCVCFSLLSTVHLTAIIAVVLLFGVNLSVASPDVMVDGLIAEHARERPMFATDLQSLCWSCMSLCAICGYLTSGFMITSVGSIVMFRILTFSSLVIITAGSFNWFGDKRKHSTLVNNTPVDTCCMGYITYDKSFVDNHGSLFFIATFIPFLAIVLSVVVLTFEHWKIRLSILLLVITLVCASFYGVAQSCGLPEVANAGLFIFLSNAVTPDIETALFYWFTDSEDGPQFSPQFVGYISGIAFGAMFVGILLYNRYLSTWTYRSIFTCTMLFLAIMNLIDVVLVKRWNLQLGIPDEIMILGDSALSPMARRFYIMPLYILAAKVCPSGAEATVFALLTALGNFGSTVSVYMGSLVLVYFDVRQDHFDNLVIVILIKTFSRLLPILLVPFLVPHGSPFDPNEDTAKENTKSKNKKKYKSSGYENVDSSIHSLSTTGSEDSEEGVIELMPSWRNSLSGSSMSPLHKRVDAMKIST